MQDPTVHVEIMDTTLSIEQAADFVDAPQNGAIDMFIGKVRNLNDGQSVDAVSYDAFTPLAKKILLEICAEAHEQHGSNLRIHVEHYRGRLSVGGVSVVVAVGSPHRAEAFLACRYVVEQLKQRVPIWKQEHYISGDSAWIKGNTLK